MHLELRIDSSDVGRCPFAHFYVYIHSSTNWWLLSVENAYIQMCIYAYLRVCVYLFSTVNCILVIQEYEHSLFIFRCRCRHILTKKYLVKFFCLCVCVRMCLAHFIDVSSSSFFSGVFALGKNFQKISVIDKMLDAHLSFFFVEKIHYST